MGKKPLDNFYINIVSLKNGTHEFEYSIEDWFFAEYPNSIIEKGNGNVHLQLEKSETMMQLDFHLDVEIELQCDVSLDVFQHPIKIDRRIILKFGEEDKEMSEDVHVIDREKAGINVANFIFEFASVEVPMKKVHPRLRDQERPALITYSEEDSEKDETASIDPRWEALKKLKNN
jgi:uncharacterized metal-binding protein YceD (DUF177 family)